MTKEITTTHSRTMIVDGVEYVTYPPPGTLVKVMELRRAEPLLADGSMRFGSLASYREWENAVLGDPNDGEGMFRMRGHPYDIGSSNPVYAWCASLPTITPDRMLLLAQHGGYNSVVQIHEPLTLIRRVHAALAKGRTSLLLHCGEVSYNRGAEVDKATLNSQKFHFNVFQKAPSFAADMEYRFSLTDAHVRAEFKSHIDLCIGQCSDIMDIEELPNQALYGTR
jgi:hypothetical protein